MSEVTASHQDRRWKWLLPALCAISLAIACAGFVDQVGAGGRPWFGWWDANFSAADIPDTVRLVQPRPGGASATAGLREDDTIDLRRQPLETRIAVVYQPMATQPTMLTVGSGAATRDVRFVGSTMWEGAPLWKVPLAIAKSGANLWFGLCALLLALNRWWNRDARVLALVLLCTAGASEVSPTVLVLPSGALGIVELALSGACAAAGSWLLVRLSCGFGNRTASRRLLEWIAYASIVASLLVAVLGIVGLSSLWVDPVRFTRIDSFGDVLATLATCAVAATVFAAVAGSAATHRARTAWLLLPLPIAILASDAVGTTATFVQSWFANVAVISASNAFFLLGAFAVTYALLGRRVLDFEFVLSRTLVLATVSLIVVASFVLLEWVLGTILTDVSHATGLIANGALALVLGLSLDFVHKRVDATIEALLFRKRRDDARALRAFAREATYVTELEVLLDLAIANLKDHTDARAAALLTEASGAYAAVRWYGPEPERTGDNDAAILALKAWHEPLDPHRYATALGGALALPMLARGRLSGIVLLGERAGGEAYAPDEIETLSTFAYGIGSALDSLSKESATSLQALQTSIAAMADAIATLRETIVAAVETRER